VVEDVGHYCRAIEAHLTKVNAGHLVRIVGPGFALVRQWYQQGIPLSAVCRGIEAKADRHQQGKSRPLRIEFCEADVRHVFEAWRRAVGLTPGSTAAAEPDAHSETRRASLPKHLERAVDRLSRAAGRLDLPEALRAELVTFLAALTDLREHSTGARGAAREAVVARLAELDSKLFDALIATAPPEARRVAEGEARRELETFKSRLAADQWDRAIAVTVDRLLRDQLGLPTLAL
jgi:hypothetical protein